MKKRINIDCNPSDDIWECPVCNSLNAWNYDDSVRFSKHYSEAVYISHGSCFDNICGNCGADFVHENSPILAECYTH
jgi:transcription elongation factor Elf1